MLLEFKQEQKQTKNTSIFNNFSLFNLCSNFSEFKEEDDTCLQLDPLIIIYLLCISSVFFSHPLDEWCFGTNINTSPSF